MDTDQEEPVNNPLTDDEETGEDLLGGEDEVTTPESEEDVESPASPDEDEGLK